MNKEQIEKATLKIESIVKQVTDFQSPHLRDLIKQLLESEFGNKATFYKQVMETNNLIHGAIKQKEKDLRDDFATAAMQGILSNASTNDLALICKDAYMVADEMMLARKTKNEYCTCEYAYTEREPKERQLIWECAYCKTKSE